VTEHHPVPSISDELRQIVVNRYLHGSPLGDLLSGLAHLLDPEQKPDPQLERDGSTSWKHEDAASPVTGLNDDPPSEKT
jgi:hypothetical protein